jgi:hypothetical protein
LEPRIWLDPHQRKRTPAQDPRWAAALYRLDVAMDVRRRVAHLARGRLDVGRLNA